MALEKPILGWVLYDGACGFCSAWVTRWGPTLAKRGFSFAPLQSDWVLARTKMSEADLVKDIRLHFVDDRLLSGSEVYLYLMRRIWWAWPFSMLFGLPGLRWLFDRSYRAFNRNRFAISRACRLNPPKTNS